MAFRSHTKKNKNKKTNTFDPLQPKRLASRKFHYHRSLGHINSYSESATHFPPRSTGEAPVAKNRCHAHQNKNIYGRLVEASITRGCHSGNEQLWTPKFRGPTIPRAHREKAHCNTAPIGEGRRYRRHGDSGLPIEEKNVTSAHQVEGVGSGKK